MKYIILLLLIIVAIYAYWVWGPSSQQPASSNTSNTSSGVIRYGNESLASLQGNGLVTLDGTVIRNELSVNGSLSAQKAHIGTLQVNGQANLDGCIVDGKAVFVGLLSAEHTTFRSELTVSTQRVSFEDCTVGALVVKKPAWTFGTQVVEFREKSICKGPITFEGGNGKIIVSGTSQILGPVHGAEVEKQ